MRHISDSVYGLVMGRGIANGRAGTRANGGKKGRGAASDGARSQVRQGEEPADLNSGKGPGVNAPAKFTGLRIVIDNSRNWRTQAPRVAPLGVRQFLVLVQ